MKFGSIDFTKQPELNQIYEKYFNPKTLLLLQVAIVGIIVPLLSKDVQNLLGTGIVLSMLYFNGVPKGLQRHFSSLLQEDSSMLYNLFDTDANIKSLFQSLVRNLYKLDNSVFISTLSDEKKTHSKLSAEYIKLIQLIRFQEAAARKIAYEIRYEYDRGEYRYVKVEKTDSKGEKYYETERKFVSTTDYYRVNKLQRLKNRIEPDKTAREFIKNLTLYQKLKSALQKQENSEGLKILQIIENSDEYSAIAQGQEKMLAKLKSFMEYFSFGSQSQDKMYDNLLQRGMDEIRLQFDLSLLESILKNTRDNFFTDFALNFLTVPPRPLFPNEICEQLCFKHATTKPLHKHWQNLVQHFNNLGLLESESNFFNKVKGVEFIYMRAFLLSVVLPLCVSGFAHKELLFATKYDEMLSFLRHTGLLLGVAKTFDLIFCEQANIEHAKIKPLKSQPTTLTDTESEAYNQQLFVDSSVKDCVPNIG